jgi:hypothetical protein
MGKIDCCDVFCYVLLALGNALLVALLATGINTHRESAILRQDLDFSRQEVIRAITESPISQARYSIDFAECVYIEIAAPMHFLNMTTYGRCVKRVCYSKIGGITLNPSATRNGTMFCQLTIESSDSIPIGFELDANMCSVKFMSRVLKAFKFPGKVPALGVDKSKTNSDSL